MRKLLIGMTVILTVLVATITESSAQAINGCYNSKTGALRVLIGSTQCKKSETPISWKQTGTIQVYDANGQYLGIYQGSPDSYLQKVYVPTLSRSVNLEPLTGKIYDDPSWGFETNDCTGDPYTEFPYDVLPFRGKLYTGKNEAPQLREIHSYFYSLGCETFTGPRYWVVARIVEVTLPFSTPVALPLEFR